MDIVLTPEIVRKLCRGLGGTKDLAADMEEACQRVLDGKAYEDVLGEMWEEAEQLEGLDLEAGNGN